MEQYPAVLFFVKSGKQLAIGLALIPAIAGVAFTVMGYHWLFAAAGVGLAPIAYLFLRSYVELICIIADMLLPK